MREKQQNYAQAVLFAFNAHKGQVRKDSKLPFIIHPLRVSELVLKNWKNHPCVELMRIVAILHDTIEDTSVTYEDILEKFGKEIADMVREVSEEQVGSIEEMHKKYLLKLISSSDCAKIVKLCDIRDNVEDTDDKIKWKKFLLKSKKVLENLKLEDKNYSILFENLKNKILSDINEMLN